MAAFRNPARNDGLVLKHWRKKGEPKAAGARDDAEAPVETDKPPPVEPDPNYHYAKFNFKISGPEYTAYEYQTHLQSDDWSKDETDYLVQLALSYDLRWPVISDRYDFRPAGLTADGEDTTSDSTALATTFKPRTLEDLKARYYTVAARMMAVQHPLSSMSASEFELHEKMAKFDGAQETRRKAMAEALLLRTPEEIQEENILLAELKRISDNQERLLEDRKELYARLESPQSIINATNPAAAAAAVAPQTYQSSQGLTQLMQTLMNADKNKKRRSLIGASTAAAAAGADPASSPAITDPTATGTPTTQKDGRDALPSATHRDSISSATAPAGPQKKGSLAAAHQPPQRRKLSPSESALYGVSTHDRLTSGVSFRHDRVARLLTAKSNIQAQRVTRALTELEIPPRLVMPTQRVCSEYERLIMNIHVLVDVRKVTEKVEGEWKVLVAQREERERRARIERGEPEPEPEEEKPDQTSEEAEKESSVKVEMESAAEGPVEGDAVGAEQGETSGESLTTGERDAEAGHKRSASVLSIASNKSAKRLKK